MPLIDNLKNRFVVLLSDIRIDAALLESQLDQQRHSLVWAKQTNEILTHTKTQAFNLILLAFNKNTLELIKVMKSGESINRSTPVIALMASEDALQRQMLINAGFDDCLMGTAPEKQIARIIEYWQVKNNSALNYIQLIQNKTKHNQRLTVTIFNKLFAELPLQIKTIKDALDCKQYALAEETVHKLHGSALFCDLEDIREPACALENCLMNKSYKTVNRYFRLLEESTLKFTSQQQAILANLVNFCR